MEELNERNVDKSTVCGLPAEVHGIPSLQLDNMLGIGIPGEWEIEDVLGDIVMAEYVDENEQGEVKRDGIWLKQEVTNRMWRVARILKKGPGCSERIKIGELYMFPSDRGIPMITFKRKKLVFFNEERIFARVTPSKQ
jgi:hypothetical protein